MTNSENIVQELKNVNYNLERICKALLCVALSGEQCHLLSARDFSSNDFHPSANLKQLWKAFGFSEDALNEVINHE